MNYLFPRVQENLRTNAVSTEAIFVQRNNEESRHSFIGQSIFIKEMFKYQVKKKFEIYKSIWQSETMFSSSVSEITNNGAYRSIVHLGQDVLPFILQDLEKSDSHWFYALEALTGKNPIKPDHRGDFKLMKADWLEWANDNLK
ncbi:MAG: hypothetical protein IPI46_12395 [Bacteroidetes bacterium]|nr:hypothetical protein [Bacteroidota bacterium]